MTSPLAHAVRIAQGITERIRQAIAPDDPDLEDLIATETDDVKERIARLFYWARLEEAEADGITKVIDDLKLRQSRKRVKAEKLRETGAWAMEELGEKKIARGYITVTLGGPSVSVEVTDIDKIPPQYLRIKKEPEKAKIKEDFKAGITIPGVALSNGRPSIIVRMT